MFARRYDSSSNYLEDRAAQGATAANGNIVGVLNFRTMNMVGKVITGITLITSCVSGAGKNNDAVKTLRFKKSTRADPTNATGGTGLSYVGDSLGSLSGINFYDASNVSRVVDPGTAFFAALKAYLETGAHTLVLYAADNVPSSGYTDNYLFLDGLRIVVTYEEGLVYYGSGEVYQKCQVYYADGGVWKQCIPFLGVDGVWRQCGG